SYARPLRGGTTDYQEFGELVVDIGEIPFEYPAGKLPRVVRPLAAQVEEGYRRYIEILSRFARVEHEELHTDVGAYDESLLRRLKEVREKGSTTPSWERIKETFANLQERFPVKTGETLAGNYIYAPGDNRESGS